MEGFHDWVKNYCRENDIELKFGLWGETVEKKLMTH